MAQTCASQEERDLPPLIRAVIELDEHWDDHWSLLVDVMQNHPDMNVLDEDGFSALMYAVRLNKPLVIPLLVNSGAEVNVKDEDGNTPLYYAVSFKHWEVLSTLVSLGADVDVLDQFGLSAVHNAVDSQDDQMLDTLLRLGANPNTLSRDGQTPLLLALSHKYLDCSPTVLNLLLDAGADPNQIHVSDRVTPLMRACRRDRCNTHAVRLLVGSASDLELKDKEGRTALHYCEGMLNWPVLRVLLQAGACPNAVDKAGNCVLSRLSDTLMTGKPHVRPGIVSEILGLILTHGGDPNVVTSQVCPDRLLSAVSRLGVAAVREVLAAGAEPVDTLTRARLCTSGTYKNGLDLSPLLTVLARDGDDRLPIANLLIHSLFYTQNDVINISGDENLCADAKVQNLLLLMKDVPSLQQLSRRLIQRSIARRKDRETCLRHLPVGPSLQRYLLFHGSGSQQIPATAAAPETSNEQDVS